MSNTKPHASLRWERQVNPSCICMIEETNSIINTSPLSIKFAQSGSPFRDRNAAQASKVQQEIASAILGVQHSRKPLVACIIFDGPVIQLVSADKNLHWTKHLKEVIERTLITVPSILIHFSVLQTN